MKRRPPTVERDIGTLTTVNRKDGQRILCKASGEFVDRTMIYNAIVEANYKQFVDYIIVGDGLDGDDTIKSVAHSLAIPVMDFVTDYETWGKQARYKLMSQLIDNGMPTFALLFFDEDFHEMVVMRELLNMHHIPFEVVHH